MKYWEKRTGGSSSAAPPAPLPAGYLGALAQWDCLRVGAVISGADKSGNGYHCGDINPNALPGLLPGRSSICPVGTGNPVAPVFLSRAATAALQLTGAITVMAKVALQGYEFAGTAGYVASCGNAAGAGDPSNSLWSLVCEQTGTTASRIIYFATYSAAKTPVLAYSNVVTLNDGQPHFICLRRDATGTVVDLQVDTDNKQTTGLTQPTGGATAFIRLGGSTSAAGTELVNGVQALVGVWGSRLTNAQVLAARSIMMGV